MSILRYSNFELQSDCSVSGVILIGGMEAFVGEKSQRSSFLSQSAEANSGIASDWEEAYSELISVLSGCRKTVVCVVHGRVSGGSGLEVIMCCDYRVVSETSIIGGTDDVSKFSLGSSSVMERLLTGQSITASEARDIGLVDEVVRDGGCEVVAMQIARKNKKRMHSVNKFQRLLYYIPEHFLKYRALQLFNLIRDYPDSLSSLGELKEVLSFTWQSEYVISQIKKQLEDRLLIPGAHTEDVLQMYLRTYKVVRFIFPSSPLEVFLRIAEPIIDHLQKRPDSVKCIVSTLLETEEEKGQREDNTMSLLIGVYGGKESFLSEYRDMLAARLVSIGSFEIDREMASLDLMRSKFTSDESAAENVSTEALTHCSVMIKDMVESRKLNAKIQGELVGDKKLKHSKIFSMIVKSSHFWPSTRLCSSSDDPSSSYSSSSSEQQFPFLPPAIQQVMREYEAMYTRMKPTQKLEWKSTEGLVTLSIKTASNNKEMEFRLSPIFVQVLALFQPTIGLPKSAPDSVQPTAMFNNSPTCLSMDAIAGSVPWVSTDRVRSVVQFWVSKGVLREVQINNYTIID